MARCNHCGTDHDVDALVRHEHEGFVVVHCPDCNCLMGQYNTHVRGR